jgi:hypothetical protein
MDGPVHSGDSKKSGRYLNKMFLLKRSLIILEKYPRTSYDISPNGHTKNGFIALWRRGAVDIPSESGTEDPGSKPTRVHVCFLGIIY